MHTGSTSQTPKGKSPAKSSPTASLGKARTPSKSPGDVSSTSSIIPSSQIKKETEESEESPAAAAPKQEKGGSSRASTPASGGVFEMCKSELGDVKKLKLSITPVKVPEKTVKLPDPSIITSIAEKVKQITEMEEEEEGEVSWSKSATPVPDRSNTPPIRHHT